MQAEPGGLVQRRRPTLCAPGLQVCAPSNSALDEIVYRLISTGLLDKDGNIFTPNIVRIGVNIHHSVQSVALDNLVQHRLGRGADNKVGAVQQPVSFSLPAGHTWH